MGYEYAENFLFNMGLDGKGCLLWAICETHETPLLGHGVTGEIIELFLTPSKSPYWNRLTEYISAELAGRGGTAQNSRGIAEDPCISSTNTRRRHKLSTP